MPSLGTTAEAVVDTLIDHGVDTVFAIPGAQTYELVNALAARQDRIRIIGGRHEQAVAYMAFGYAQATGELGVVSVVPGPGLLNAGAALLTAYGESQPVLCIVGDVAAGARGRGLGHVHEMPDQLATLRTLTKWASNIEHVSEASGVVAEAIARATSGRPRPVAVSIPRDTLAQRGPYRVTGPRPLPTPPVDKERIAAAADILATARNPMIMVGGGAREARAEVAALAEYLQAATVAFRGGRGVVSDDSPLSFTSASGFERWADTDVLIGIGSRLELTWARWPDRAPGLKVVNIDIDPEQAVRLTPDVALVGDAAETTKALAEAVAARRGPAPDRSAEFLAVKEGKAKEIEDLGPTIEFVRAIRAALPEDGFLVEEVSQVGFVSSFGFGVTAPRQFITCGHQSTLGFGFPTALGVQAAHPDRAVVSVSGDGGFMFGVQELATAVQYDLPVVAVVFNNQAYGNVKLDLEGRYGADRAVGVDLHNPDFVALAESFGADAYRIDEGDGLQVAAAKLTRTTAQAVAKRRPAVIEVRCALGAGESPWKYLEPASRKGA
ncbi:thiamine pyrophosphate-dependent enzyme [Streptomyces fuscichromogenes]|uniref:Acetolactate synthase I/II/III large subunit n=1 Tax=Streptomyces fuscichromogenes TaxID=1324013 RepID=A0A918CT59_9ACTN|nr:thiamine pyrophosphate-dependent enzyme [Streptomyces fuscichromogenes]GGN22704.1 acetolactate synthase I/II/III large subunit [Streptomyces fuscichromogenes]